MCRLGIPHQILVAGEKTITCFVIKIQEAGTSALRRQQIGAGDQDRTGDIQLGKLTFYH